jgi:hypothetical protein
VLRQADLRRYLFLGGKGMFLYFYVKKIVPVDTLLDDDCSIHPLLNCRALQLVIRELRCDAHPQSYVSPPEVEIGQILGEY